MTIGDRIKKIRREFDLTQEAFASRIGSVQNTITGYESGRRNPSAPIISLICREFGVNEQWLRDGIGDIYIPDPNNELEALAGKYKLSVADQMLIEKYINLKPEARKAVLQFMTDVAASLNKSDSPYSDIPDSPDKLEQMFPPLEEDKDKKGGLG
uniref:Helix-turn-helix domain protein n=1 Tax=Myoviridae sp. ctp7F23 TaxID=2825174 RepID=A0A8S5U8N2_9CAUD|nr:MAG TPA: helix-turn-helix domain protein [Myoviridae sp. ctp7F23]